MTTPAGVRYAYTVESYRDEAGRPRQRVVISHGRVDDLEKADPEALVKLRRQAVEMSGQKAAVKGRIGYDTTTPWDGGRALGVGWWLADAMLARLDPADALRRSGHTGVVVTEVLRLLVGARVVDPCSKKATVEKTAARLMGAPDVGLRQVYDVLDAIAEASVRLQRTAWKARGGTTADLATVDYDVTNYFFHVDHDDDGEGVDAPRGRAVRRRGHSKESRPDPIIQMGLFLDAAGLPVCFRLFDGNVPDTSTLGGAISEFKDEFPTGRVVVVADKAMASGPNRGLLLQSGDGWIVSTSARQADRTIRDWLLDEIGWTWNDEHTMKTKSMTITSVVPITINGVSGLKKTVEEKLIARWSVDRAAKDGFDRAQAVSKAEQLAADPARFAASNRRGIKKYVTADTIIKATGEVLGPKQTVSQLAIDRVKAAREAEMDGFWMLRTSETGMTDEAVLARYAMLWRIEQTFRVTKTELSARPVFVRTPAHIEAHFTICFLALLVTRLLERWTGLPASRLVDALQQMTVIDCGQGVHRLQRTNDWTIIDQTVGASLNQSWATIEQLRDWRRRLTTAAKTAEFPTP